MPSESINFEGKEKTVNSLDNALDDADKNLVDTTPSKNLAATVAAEPGKNGKATVIATPSKANSIAANIDEMMKSVKKQSS